MRISVGVWRWVIALDLIACLVSMPARAQGYPNQPIHFIVPFTPGAGADTTARILAQKLTPILGQPVIVENRGGASGTIGTEAVARAAPDGYTWVLGHDPAFTINPHLRKMPYDPIRDFTPVVLIVKVPLVLVAKPDVAANSVKSLVALAKKNPDKLTIASSGNGSSGHLAAEVFMAATGARLFHVPYRGQKEAITDVLAERIDLNFTAIADIIPLVAAKKLKVLAIGAPKRFAGFPDVPTIEESGYPGFDVSAFHALLMPAKTPQAIVNRVNAAVNQVLQMPDVAKRFQSLGLYVAGGSPDVLAKLLVSDSERWAKVIKAAGIKVD